MDRFPTDPGDDEDLDALMMRVREVAMTAGPGAGAARPQAAGDAPGADIDLVRVIDAQNEWNEHARQSLAALMECLLALRDDWTDAQAGLRREIGRLSARVERHRPRARRAAGAKPGTGKRRPAVKRRPRS